MKLWALRITYESKICSDSILHMPGSLTIKHHYLTTHTTESCIILCINLNQKHERCGIVLLLENILNLLRGCWCGCSSVSVSCSLQLLSAVYLTTSQDPTVVSASLVNAYLLSIQTKGLCRSTPCIWHCLCHSATMAQSVCIQSSVCFHVDTL